MFYLYIRIIFYDRSYNLCVLYDIENKRLPVFKIRFAKKIKCNDYLEMCMNYAINASSS